MRKYAKWQEWKGLMQLEIEMIINKVKIYKRFTKIQVLYFLRKNKIQNSIFNSFLGVEIDSKLIIKKYFKSFREN